MNNYGLRCKATPISIGTFVNKSILRYLTIHYSLFTIFIFRSLGSEKSAERGGVLQTAFGPECIEAPLDF